jgi:hypothetical protein
MDHGARGLGTLSSPQRNHYFYGKLMDVPHFDMEQWYGNKKRWLLNRLGLGYGVLCGLGLTIKENKVCIAPGVAIDWYGREIIVPHEVCIDPWAVTDECGRPKTNALSKTADHEVYICLAYKECQTDFMPAYVTDCNAQQSCVPSTTVESYSIIVRDDTLLKPQGGLDPKICKTLQRTDLTESEKRQVICTLIAAQTCSPVEQYGCVAIGTVYLTRKGTIDLKKLDQCSTRSTLLSNEKLLDMILCMRGGGKGDTGDKGDKGDPGVGLDPSLTKIIRINWPHDKQMQFSQFKKGLTVDFSKKIKLTTTNGRAWFLVTAEFVSPASGTIIVERVLDQSITLVNANNGVRFLPALTFEATFNRRLAEGDQGSALLRIVVNGDFIVDEDTNKAVDTNPTVLNLISGKSPKSGDGVPGGRFESWVVLTK